MSERTTLTSGRHIHKIIEKDIIKLLGLCSRCGVVPLKKTVRKDYTRYQCMTSWRDSYTAQNQRRLGSKTHGLSTSEAQEFISDKVCALCKTEFDLCVDHNHETQKLRGVLCRKHNVGLGLFKDDPELLRRAVDYLEGTLPIPRSIKHEANEYYGPVRSSNRAREATL